MSSTFRFFFSLCMLLITSSCVYMAYETYNLYHDTRRVTVQLQPRDDNENASPSQGHDSMSPSMHGPVSYSDTYYGVYEPMYVEVQGNGIRQDTDQREIGGYIVKWPSGESRFVPYDGEFPTTTDPLPALLELGQYKGRQHGNDSWTYKKVFATVQQQ